ncbi:MAG: hypothetical protein FD125_2973 [bacterium]|nr:MAG: hypothetical protein FD125_2973 [bacterium]
MPNNPFALKPLIAVVLIVCAVNIMTIATARWAAGADTEQMVTAALSMARGPQGGMSDAQRETAASMMRPMIRFYPVTSAVGVLIVLLALSTVFFAALALADAGLRWPVVFGAAAYAALAQAIAGLILTAVLSAARPPTAAQLVDSSFLSTNLAAVLPESAGPVLLAAARSLDALTIVYLMVFVAMLGSYGKARVSENTIGVVVGVCFVIWLAIRMGWAAMFGG